MTAGPVFLLGLPTLADNALWRTALRLGAPVLISANALSLWESDPRHGRSWRGFRNDRGVQVIFTWDMSQAPCLGEFVTQREQWDRATQRPQPQQ